MSINNNNIIEKDSVLNTKLEFLNNFKNGVGSSCDYSNEIELNLKIKSIVNEFLNTDIFSTMNNIIEPIFSYNPWFAHISLITLIMFVTLISIIAFFIPRTPKGISTLNIICAFTIFLYIITLPLHNYQTDLKPIIGIEYTPFIYLFALCGGLHVISFLAISNNVTFTKDNVKIEYPLLIVFLFFSSFILISATNWLIMLITLEVITFIIAVLVAFQRNHNLTPSVGIRYILFSAIPSGALILGIIEFYIYCGSFNLFDIEKFLQPSFDLYTSQLDSIYISNIIVNSLEPLGTSYWNQIYSSVINELSINNININNNFTNFFNTCKMDPVLIQIISDSITVMPEASEPNAYLIHNNISFQNYGFFNEILGRNLLTGLLYEKYNLLNPLNTYDNFEYIQYNFQSNDISTSLLISSNHENIKIPLVIIVALYLLLFNIFFKLTAAPFHFWAPVIYEGAPLPITMFLSIFTKIVMIFFLIKILITSMLSIYFEWSNLLFFSGLLSIVVGIYGAMSETKIKRFFVFSSIGHVGFMLLGIANCSGSLEGQGESLTATIIYLIIYFFSTFVCWLILFCSKQKITYLTQLSGLAKTNPVLSLLLAIIVLSMSGIPPLAGFFVKFEILHTLLQSQAYGLTFFTLLLTIFSFFYYLRVIKILYFEPTSKFTLQFQINKIQATILSSFFFIIVGFSIYFQQPLLYNIKCLIYQLF